jgi:hypothetical protein
LIDSELTVDVDDALSNAEAYPDPIPAPSVLFAFTFPPLIEMDSTVDDAVVLSTAST